MHFDKETGLGNWTDEQIYDAMVKGIRPSGHYVVPVMPYEAYSGMAQERLGALHALLGCPAVAQWSRDDIAHLLLTGTKPDLDNVEGLMAEVVEGTSVGYKDMTEEDALAIADLSVPPIRNRIE